ncbi:MAG: glycosyltransferase [Planctomycetota bacterium]
MRVLMLGWEFPPHITGGLGTACAGLTRGLHRHGTQVIFALPKPVDGDAGQHVTLISPRTDSAPPRRAKRTKGSKPTTPASPTPEVPVTDDPSTDPAATASPAADSSHPMEVVRVPSPLVHPYQRTALDPAVGAWPVGDQPHEEPHEEPPAWHAATWPRVAPAAAGGLPTPAAPPGATAPPPPAADDYGGDLLRQVEGYAEFVLDATDHLEFDLIHAHDWMTYPAGLRLAAHHRRPLVVHVHSTEFDRAGIHVSPPIFEIERRGMNEAHRVIAVSQLTKSMVVSRYGVPADKVEVVYNGVEFEPGEVGMTGIRRKDRIVLYFGRITYQKGPEYFIRAAKRVLEYMDDVKFVVAGSGDMARRMIEMAAESGIGHKVLFTGFLRGDDIKRVFALADLYVMPSVSEPFGIAPLEAMSHDVPVLISRTSGVSEVLTHALKVDFWNVDDMANKIIAVLRHPPLSQTLREHGAFEVRKLTWDGAAQRCEQVYEQLTEQPAAVAS